MSWQSKNPTQEIMTLKLEEEVFFGRAMTAAEDGYLHSSEARLLRILFEMNAPKAIFREHLINNTIVMFGSARTRSMEEATKNLESIKQNQQGKKSKQGDLQLKKAQRAVKISKYYEDAADLAEKLTIWSKEIIQPEKHFYICSGGGPGIMEAANKGASRAGGHSIGLNINLPFEQDANPYQTDEISFEFHYFFVRKFWFAYLAKALVAFPGGFGTMDELFEMLTLIQTQKIVKPMPIILYGKEFWEKVLNFETMVEWGMVAEEDLGIFRIIDGVDEAFEFLKEKLVDSYL